MPNFTIYFHKDFDGICSAALFIEIAKYINLIKENDDIIYKSVDYNLTNIWLNEKLHKPNAVLDFLYHPDSDWWFDHHVSSFKNYKIKKQYKKNNMQNWDISYLSCPSLIRDHFKNKIPLFYYTNDFFKILNKYNEWIIWSDIIDSAKYESPKEIIDLMNPCLRINATLSLDTSIEYLIFLIDSIITKNPEKIIEIPKIKSYLDIIIKKQNDIIKIYKNLIKVQNNKVAWIDQSEYSFPFQRYLSYYFYPDINYTICLYKKSDNVYSISVGKNPWKEFNSINIGKYCKIYGGGGRKDVGGILINNLEEGKRVLNKIVNYLIDK